MKILKIFGLVVGVHVVAFMFVFAIPGCRSTTRHSPPPPASVQAERSVAPVASSPAVAAADSPSPISPSAYSPSTDHSLNAAPASAPTSVSFPSASSSGSPGPVRFNPTRPNSAAAPALQSGPPPEMTPASTYTVVSGDSLWKIAKKHNLTAKELATANNLKTDTPLREGQKLLIPGKATPSTATSGQPSGQTADTLVYKVKAGDTLAVIAKRAGTTSANIKALNHLKNDNVHAGQDLILPAGSTAAASLAATSDSEASAAPAKSSSEKMHHTVRPGETLVSIAHLYGVTRSQLAVENNIADPKKIHPGQDLVIPAAGKKPSSTTGTPATNKPSNKPATEQNPATTPATQSPISPSTDSASPIAPAPITPPEVPVQDMNPVSAPKSGT